MAKLFPPSSRFLAVAVLFLGDRVSPEAENRQFSNRVVREKLGWTVYCNVIYFQQIYLLSCEFVIISKDIMELLLYFFRY